MPLSPESAQNPPAVTAVAVPDLAGIGLLGLGLMGSAKAERFLARGFEVLGFDIDPARLAGLVSRGARAGADAIISAARTILTLLMFLGTAPLQVSFLPIVFAQGFVATLFFGWLPLYLPELFPTRVRAAGSGIAYNLGRFTTALGVLGAGALFAAMGGSYPKVGATCGLIYLLGVFAIAFAPDTGKRTLDES